ncbi:MAG: ATP-dependent Clp protease proteolytic subunit [Candidatus Wolfebacteria bacterium GW2011_GWE1_48_7]|uniref:ATP-dependent Clp protease proteolytic subunit n=2 Tax=Candidatus Wolfeibacteriota TaxID=1752735 RepID=A0A0G1U652_9BACT|nr:MAG: ATP-dependent Clp protease proteolytic subunit [Candidatus Wolfebacteria bacterium GW2011_GWC2_46_275]KKU41733.1 MAG: ATP-dependent Clp protease proteolytic subunit [Candidatus Wolfebacteria bacterium GW2011_GWB2_46_69]KKU59024.1 MAG: ATP-dependent Clp protease proteolytic subunit [Candidatus Wolfebacteria bacterium GW2011_GWE2_47_12]KKU65516.1 MAG: ATP-dependent Clp protease proteolytic subunit [Candidatus Wolfebacteria bacterium GW2011_GWD2_47_17]KKU72085.1 MAG: ATP-dependent Clp prot
MAALEGEMLRDMLEKGVIYLSGEVTPRMAEQLGKAMMWLDAVKRFETVNLIIDSQGGSVVAGLQMYELIRNSSISVRGVVYRRAFSTAAIVLQACHKRVAFSSAEILFHDTRAEVRVTDSEEELAEVLKSARKRQQMLYRIIASKLGKPIEEATRFSKLEMCMSAYEALERGFVDEVIDLIP